MCSESYVVSEASPFTLKACVEFRCPHQRMSQEEAFMRSMQEVHIPISTNMGAATFWAPKSIPNEIHPMDVNGDPLPGPSVGTHVPRPDRTIGTLSWLSPLLGLFGVDHFYLRSPKTGLAKLLTLGGLGIWWIWDWVQIWAEPKRVQTYGLSAPFDIFHGIAQGMITDSSKYQPERDFGIWMLMNLLGFNGFALFYIGRYTQGMRMLIMFALMMYFFPYGGIFHAFRSVWGIFTFVFFVMFASGVVYHYCNTLYYMFSDDLLKTGIPLSAAGEKMMNPETKPGEEGDDDGKESFIKKIYNFQSITGHDIIVKFWIKSQFEKIVEHPDAQTTLMDTWYAPFFYWGWILAEGTILSLGTIVNGVFKLVFPAVYMAQQEALATLQEAKAAKELLKAQAAAAIATANEQVSAAATLAQNPLHAVPSLPSKASDVTSRLKQHMTGGGLQVSDEGQILGATVLALLAGGGLKAVIDYLMTE
jgi:hypothetical protein